MFKTQKILALLILFLFATISFASTVRLSDTTTPLVNIANIYDVYNTIGGDGTSTSAPLKLYVPISGGTTQTDNHILGTSLPTAASSSPLNITINIVNSTGNTVYPTLYADDPSGTDYIYVGRSSVGCGGSSTCDGVVSSFSMSTICASALVDCTTLTSVKTTTLYLFLSESGIDTDLPDPTSGTDGIFIELKISGAVYTSAPSIQPVLTQATIGDKRLRYTYTVPSIQTYFRDVVAYDNTVTQSGSPKFSDLNSSKELLTTDDEIPVNTSGYFDLKNLTNERTYHTTIAVRDKFGFFTFFADTLEAQPLSIAEFLEKNQCYFISAGFMKQHYVLDYFRYIRDSYLMKYRVGRLLVDYYYATAPKYVPFILEHPVLQASIRLAAFFLYFILNYGVYLFAFILLVRFLKLSVSKSQIIK
ncbi:CFI-box-CTERM domain-containing protein [Halobacteriovorax sp. HLS]|uniref:CFI-box-CTERM domain-containing protein n=1 Tax=Halobacteriovorax sp. HLS TaxID=2234000 RepID=UPI000FD6F59F|nr:CFI-box-CTERM domain-containing protein [Halobacteriovorax sp. HLS]